MQALGLQHRGVLSAVVTSFGLSILLRADTLWVHPLAAFARDLGEVRDPRRRQAPVQPGEPRRHRSRPRSARARGSRPGQWGNDLAFAALFVALGGTVVARARRSTSRGCSSARGSGSSRCACCCSASRWTSGCTSSAAAALLLFAFFMICDPMTIPNDARARPLRDPRRERRVRCGHFVAVQAQRAACGRCSSHAARADHRPPMAGEKFEWRPRSPQPPTTAQRSRATERAAQWLRSARFRSFRARARSRLKPRAVTSPAANRAADREAIAALAICGRSTPPRGDGASRTQLQAAAATAGGACS